MTTHVHYIKAQGVTVAIYKSKSTPSEETLYPLYDHLGSISAIANTSGDILQELSYDPWGKRRTATDWSDASTQLTSTYTPRGFTGHEMLDDVSLVHMNGRVYDPHIGRFTSADPFVQSPTFSQSFNRYAYAFNSPLNYVDPTGYSNGWNIWGGADEQVMFSYGRAWLFSSMGPLSRWANHINPLDSLEDDDYDPIHPKVKKFITKRELVGGGEFIEARLGFSGGMEEYTGVYTRGEERLLLAEVGISEGLEFDCGNGADCIFQNPGMSLALNKKANRVNSDNVGKVVVTGGDSYWDYERNVAVSHSDGKDVNGRKESSGHNDHNGNISADLRSSALNIDQSKLADYISEASGGDLKLLINLRYTNEYGFYKSEDKHLHVTCISDLCRNY